MNQNRRAARLQPGFTTLQMVVTIAIISVVSVFGVLGITNARAEFRLQNSARLFASYIEKARVDAIRRHAPDGEESSIETFGPGTSNYAVTMDFGSGALETRTFQLETGLSFSTAAKKVSFDWRGRITEAWVFQIFSSFLERSLPVDVSGSGDVAVGEQHFPDQLIPPVEVTQVTGDVDADPTPTASPSVEATPPIEDPGGGGDVTDPVDDPPSDIPPTDDGNGGDNGNGGTGNGNGNGNASPTPTPTPTPTPNEEIPQCVSTISPNQLKLSQSDVTKQTGSATFTMANASGVRVISASLLGNGNSLNIEVGLQRIDGSGSSVITITTKHGAGNRGVFIVEVSGSPSCGSAQKLEVSVSN
jgi:type II secretory pathway pseudopilin PulG